jgi:hypothetical protein
MNLSWVILGPVVALSTADPLRIGTPLATHLLMAGIYLPLGTGQQVGNTFLKNLVLRQLDRVEKTLTFQELVDVRCCKGGVASAIAVQVPFPITLNDRFQNPTPTDGAVDIARAKGTPLQIAELVEHEQQVIAGAAEMVVIGRALMLAMGRADGLVHVEHDHLRWAAVMNLVDPRPVHSGQHFNVCIGRQKLRLEPPIWLVDTASLSMALPPTNHRMAGSRPRRPASFRPHNHQGDQTPTDGTAPSCRAIRSCRYSYPGKHPRQPRSGQGHRQALDKRATHRQK